MHQKHSSIFNKLASHDTAATVVNILVRGSAAVAALVAQFLIIHTQGEAAYGRYAALVATISLLAIFTKLGGDVTATRLAALGTKRAVNGDANEAIAILINSTFTLSIVTFTTYSVVTLITANKTSQDWAIFLSLASLTGSSLLASILRGYERNLAVDAIDGLARPALMVIFGGILLILPSHAISSHGSVVDSYIITNIVIAATLCALIREYVKPNEIMRCTVRLPVRQIFRHYSGFQVAATIAAYAVFQLDTYILSFYADAIQVGGYNVVCNYVRVVIFIAAILSARAQAGLAREYHFQRLSEFRRIYRIAAIKSAITSLLAFVVLLAVGKTLLTATSVKYEGLTLALIILAAGHCFNSVAIIGLTALNMAGRNLESFLCTATGAIVVLPCYFLLIPALGAIGAAASAAAGMLAMSTCSIYLVLKLKL